jgi:uncharacterized membrane protein
MNAERARNLVVVVLLLAGCGARGGLGSGGSGAGGAPAPPGGAGGVAGDGAPGGAGGAGGAGGTPSTTMPPPPPSPDAGTPSPAACACAPGSGVDILACGGHQAMINWGFDAPYAVITPDAGTVVFNRCVPAAAPSGSCTLTAYRWTRETGTAQIASNAWAVAVGAQGHAALIVRNPGDTGAETLALWRDGATIDVPLTRSAVQLLSDDGSIVVGAYQSDANTIQAARWTAAAGMTLLGDLPGGPTASWPNAMNADATVVVGYGNTAAGQEPFRWTAADGLMVDLGVLQTSTSSSVQAGALGTSADGSVIVGSSTANEGTQLFRWTAAGGLTALGPRFDDLPGGPFGYFFIWTPQLLVTSDGATVAGTTSEPSLPLAPGAFRWTAGLGTVLLTPGTPSITRGVSDGGDVVLGSKVSSLASPAMPAPLAPLVHTPFVWRTRDGVHDLAPLLQTAGADLTGLTLAEPIALSADGGVVVGHATCGDAPVIYRAALPPPAYGPP